jgi:hypothetical protein
MLQPLLLDFSNLRANELPPLHVTFHLVERVRWDRFALRRAQVIQALGCLLQLWIEFADAEAGQRRFQAIDDPARFAGKTFTFAARPSGVLLCQCRNGGHLAMVALATQPSEKARFNI